MHEIKSAIVSWVVCYFCSAILDLLVSITEIILQGNDTALMSSGGQCGGTVLLWYNNDN